MAHGGEPREGFGEGLTRIMFPAVGRDHRFAILDPDVQRERHPVGSKAVEHRGKCGGIIEREAPDHHPRDPCVDHPVDLVDGAEPARDLERELGRSGQGDEQLMLAWFAGARAVEIDQMRLACAALREGRERGGGIVRITRLAVEIALRQPHAATPDQVDGGEQDHDARNASRKRLPAADDRSGWNCAPHHAPYRTAAGIVASP